MVFTKFSRIPLQTFSKTLSSGYAQSVVAASHSSYATTTTSLGTLGNYPAAKFARVSQLQSAFQGASSSGAGAKAGHTASAGSSDGGLQAYVAAWQHAQQTGDDSDWRQHQFTQRIGWKSAGPHTNSRPPTRKDTSFRGESLRPVRTSAERSYSENTALELKKSEDVAAEAEAVAKIDAAIAQEIESVKESQGNSPEQIAEQSSSHVGDETESLHPVVSAPASSKSIFNSSETPASSISAEETLALSAHIVSLAHQQRFREIPSVFESIQRSGNVPTIEAYNALLVAAIRIPADHNVAFGKALEVYAHLISREVVPNHDTHLILIQLFLGRAIENLAAKRSLSQRKLRYGGMEESQPFLFKSQELDHQALAEDDSLFAALKQFRAATAALTGFTLPAELYQSLIRACAQENLLPEMLDVFKHMEENGVSPQAGMFSTMLQAFASSKDLLSAAECYEGYRRLAVADNSNRTSNVEETAGGNIVGRTDKDDNDVHAALIKAYLAVDKVTFARRFYSHVMKSYETAVEDHDIRLNDARSTIILDAFLQHSLDRGVFAEALDHIRSENLESSSQLQGLVRICTAAADANHAEIATTSFAQLPSQSKEQALSAGAMVAMNVRRGELMAAKPYWDMVRSSTIVDGSIVDLATMYTVALLRNGRVEEGLREIETLFARLGGSIHDQQPQSSLPEEIDEAISLLGGTIMRHRISLSPSASLTFLRLVDDHSAWNTPLASHVISSFTPDIVASLRAPDLALMLKAQATFLCMETTVSDEDHSMRFAHLLESSLAGNLSLDGSTVRIVNQALPKLQQNRHDLVKVWYDYLNPAPTPTSVVSYSGSVPASPMLSSQTSESSFDPYAHNTDLRGSTIIADTLDKMGGNGRNDSYLADALSRFRQMRRIGRHPRYITYSKLITSAAKVGRKDVVHDVFNTACRDVPLLPQNEIVKYGWYSILDAMVSAYLVMGDREYATKYHSQLLDLGSAPSANTFGLYITTLKESTKTFDEATEAVKIFHRAVHEGVEPTSFLYNALIGKLGKARRIDDCLQYFAEMRAQNIRPTSVTYGTIVNALCRVSDERFAEEMFDEMESMPNYKPRPAPYNSLIQYFLNTKRDRSKVLAYYSRMKSNKIAPTMHTYKLLIDAYASLDPVDMDAAEEVLETIRRTGQEPEAVHYASLIHAKGCVAHDLNGARAIFDSVIAGGRTRSQPCLYQALLESMVANHKVGEADLILKDMQARNIEITPYIANALIHGWAGEGNIARAQSVFDLIGKTKREPSTYEAMTRAFLSSENHQAATHVVSEMLSRGYPSAVSGKVLELVGGVSPVTPVSA